MKPPKSTDRGIFALLGEVMEGIVISEEKLTELILNGKIEFECTVSETIELTQEPIYGDHLMDYDTKKGWCDAKNPTKHIGLHCNRLKGHNGLHERTAIYADNVRGRAVARWK